MDWWEEALRDCAVRMVEWADLRDRLLREVYAQGVSYRQLAAASGLSHESVRSIVRGVEQPRIARWRLGLGRRRPRSPTAAEVSAELAMLIEEQARDDRTWQIKWDPEPWEQRRRDDYP